MFDRFKAPFQAVMIRRLVMHDGAKQPREVSIKVGVSIWSRRWRVEDSGVGTLACVAPRAHCGNRCDPFHAARFRVYRTRAGARL